MVKIIDRYIAKTLFMSTIMTSFIIVGVLILISLLSELKSLGKGDYGMLEASFYILLRLPNQFYQFFPLIALLGSITGLSILSSSSEMIVMRAAGFSMNRIIYSTMMTAFGIILAMSFLGETFGPSLSYQAAMHKENAKNVGEAVVTASGVWLHVENNFIHIQHVIGRQLLEDVTRYQFNDQHQLEAAYYAKTLTLKNRQWQMNDVVKTAFYKNQTKSESFPTLTWTMRFNQNLLNVGLVEPNEMSLAKLTSLSHYLERNGLQANEYRYDFWRRVFQPLASLLMVFLAIPFVLGAFKTANLGWRIVMGLLVGFSFFILNALLGQFCVVYQIPILIAALTPTLLFAVVGVMLARNMLRT